MGSNYDRDFQIVTDVFNGKTHAAVAKEYGLSVSRVGQIFSKFTRLLRGYNSRDGKERLQGIFSQEKYPHAWRQERGELYFSSHYVLLQDWRAEKEKVFAFIDEISKKD